MFSLLLLGLLAGDSRYAHPEMLMEAAELARPDVAKGLRILDARDKAKYAAGHVPGALSVDPNAWSKQFADGQDPDGWAKRLGQLGIDLDTPVVVYDDALTGAARVWWILRYWGVKDVRLLNGGWAAYQAAKGPITKEVPTVEAKSPTLRPQVARLATRRDVLDLLKKEKKQIVDARTLDEHCGKTGTARKLGSIPGAVHLDWADLIDRKTQRFKSADEIAKLLRKRSVRLEQPSVTYCQSGGRASVMAFALELMGARDVRNYYRSWQDWGNVDETPVAKPMPQK